MALMNVLSYNSLGFLEFHYFGNILGSADKKANSIPNILRGGAETIEVHHMGQLKSKFKCHLWFGGCTFSVSNPVLVLTE